MEWSHYILFGFLSASVFFVAGLLALLWAYRNGQLSNMDKGANSIFDEDEPQGKVTDAFPVSRNRRKPGGNR